MRRSAVLVALPALALAGALAGCGGDEPPPGLPGAASGSGSGSGGVSTSTSAPASTDPAARVPPAVEAELRLPADVIPAFEALPAATGAAAAVLRDWQISQRAFLAAAVRSAPGYPTLLRYQAQDALVTSTGTIRLKQQRNRTVIGTRRYYGIRVVKVTAREASVSWCVDDSKFFARDRSTNKAVIVHGPSDYLRMSGLLLSDPRLRHWVLVRAVGEEGARC